MYASGEDVEAGILGCEGENGAFFRSPLRRERSDQGVTEINAFSRDMATGLSLAATADAKRQFGGRILAAYDRWLMYVLTNGCRACVKDSDGRCYMTPGVFWMAAEAGANNVPIIYKATRWLQIPYLYIAASFNQLGYPMHLTAVSIYAMAISRGGRKKLPFLAKLAARKLAGRQPKNPFFAWLAGSDAKAHVLLYEVKGQLKSNGQGDRHQWGWEREDAEQAWKDSCGWDVVFMENLLKNGTL